MLKQIHEIRDPIHTFIRMSTAERKVLDSRPLQRLRHIHQLATTSLVYPGATHKRFEHSLGVMELATQVYDVITSQDRFREDVRINLQVGEAFDLEYWRRVLRMAALCHDIGHLPFSHAAEKDLLPKGLNHECITRDLILDKEMKYLWKTLHVEPVHVAKLAVGPKEYPESPFTDWEAIMAEIITGDAFGVDRMDYLLRDSLHLGVAYGHFDHHRLIDTMRILSEEQDGSIEPKLGVEIGGIHGAEALLLARYFMFTQIYFHPIRRIYDIHLMDFLKQWLKGGQFPNQANKIMEYTDNEVMAGVLVAARKNKEKGHDPARRIIHRTHFRLLYERNPEDIKKNPAATEAIYEKTVEQFGHENVRMDIIPAKRKGYNFPVLTHDDRIVSSTKISETLNQIPPAVVGYVFIEPKLLKKATKWLEDNRDSIISAKEEEENEL
ncbi:HD domain-containing protein [Desulfococcaceae bacterium HSG7]|nr:HD domain-containing protein [Desulfococcaceae bacterium HSG7]